MTQALKEKLQEAFQKVSNCEVFYQNRSDVVQAGLVGEFVAGSEPMDYETDSGKESYAIYEFSENGETALVKFQGTYWSYEGHKFEEWMFVKAQPVQVLQYVKE